MNPDNIRDKILCEHSLITGAWVLSWCDDVRLHTNTYYGYTKEEALQEFITEMNGEEES